MGAFVLIDAGPALVGDDHLTLWLAGNSYGDQVPRPRTGMATLVTPPSTVAALRRGYPVQVGAPSAQAEVVE